MPGKVVWLARLALALVLAWNLQAALAFILAPQAHAPGFELDGVPGQVMVRGLGILFLMWNVPYAAALVHPARHRTAFVCAVVAQGIGLAGETWLLLTLPAGHVALQATGWRFVAFDGAGLLLLAAAWALVWRVRRAKSVG